MAETIIRGPSVVLGPLMGGSPDVTDGPSIVYQGDVILDVRFSPANKDGMQAARIPSFLSSPYVVMVDNIPQAYNSAAVAALANVTQYTPMTLVSVAPGGGAPGVASVAVVPLIPQGSSTPVNVLALDFGFTTGTVTVGSTTVTVPDATVFSVGQWICIGGAGNVGKTLPLITQVTSLATATTIKVSNASAAALSNAPIGSANAYGVFPAQLTANAVTPYLNGGVAGIFNPLEGLARAVSITGVAASLGGAFLVKGYDVYGYPMSETITVGAGAVTKFGQKAFKYIASVTPQLATEAHNYSVGNSDTFGCALRTDKWEYVQILYNSTFTTTATGWLKADITATATTTTGDVRGTVQVSTNGNGSSISGGAATDGTKRLAIMMSVPLWNLINATPVNPAPMFGSTQA